MSIIRLQAAGRTGRGVVSYTVAALFVCGQGVLAVSSPCSCRLSFVKLGSRWPKEPQLLGPLFRRWSFVVAVLFICLSNSC